MAAGADAMGVDISPRAIERARDKAAERALVARFVVADALDLGQFRRTSSGKYRFLQVFVTRGPSRSGS
jgi:ubiquinone/menaquinone biosynthesis C-methylase UbiE